MKKTLFFAGLLLYAASCQQSEETILQTHEAQSDDLWEPYVPGARFKTPKGDGGPAILPGGVIPCTQPAAFDLIAGRHHDVGSVTISNDAVNLYVTYYTTENLQKLHLWIGNDLKDIPRNPAGNPVIGLFFYKAHAKNASTYTFTIPLSELAKRKIDCGRNIIVVAHAEVNGESAFGGNEPVLCFKRWAYFMKYQIVCCQPPVADGSETAYAKGNWVFVKGGCHDLNPECLPGLNISASQWGWALNFEEPVEFAFDIYAGAEGNDTGKGKKAGRLAVEFYTLPINGVPTAHGFLTYVMDEGWTMKEVHIYAGDNPPQSATPAQYGHKATFPAGETVYTYTINFVNRDENRDGTWFIAHATVKPVPAN